MGGKAVLLAAVLVAQVGVVGCRTSQSAPSDEGCYRCSTLLTREPEGVLDGVKIDGVEPDAGACTARVMGVREELPVQFDSLVITCGAERQVTLPLPDIRTVESAQALKPPAMRTFTSADDYWPCWADAPAGSASVQVLSEAGSAEPEPFSDDFRRTLSFRLAWDKPLSGLRNGEACEAPTFAARVEIDLGPEDFEWRQKDVCGCLDPGPEWSVGGASSQ